MLITILKNKTRLLLLIILFLLASIFLFSDSSVEAQPPDFFRLNVGQASEMTRIELAGIGIRRPPVVDVWTEEASIPHNSTTRIHWSTVNADDCVWLIGFTGPAIPIEGGSRETDKLTIDTIYKLECTGPEGTAINSVIVRVEAPIPPVDPEPVPPPPRCFIATVLYGSSAPETEMLRQFRDEYLLSNTLGRLLASGYYKYSPFLTDFISQNQKFKNIFRIILEPVIGIIGLLV